MCLIVLTINAQAQVVVAFQGGEGTPADNWGFSAIANAGGPLPPGITATNPNTGFYAIRAGGGNNVGCSGGTNCIVGGGGTGCPMHGRSIVFNMINVSCLDNVQLSLYHRSHSACLGNGFDNGENLFFEVSFNGVTWTTVGRVGGFGDYNWDYSTNPAGHPSSGYTAPNPFIYNVPAGTDTFVFRARGTLNRSDEIFYIDDVKLTTTSTAYGFPGTAGLWNGEINTDWHNTCNWNSRLIPLATTNVLIPNGASNSCEVYAGATGNCRNLIVDHSKLIVENTTSTINVNGNLTIEANGELDLSLNATQGGTMNLYGYWYNRRDESWFDEEGSTVNFVGNGIQSITVSNDTKESFYKLNINNVASNIVCYTDLWIDKNNNGGGASMLTLTNGLLNLNAHEAIIYNPLSTAVQRTGGGVMSERVDNTSRLIWNIGAFTGSYIFPFSKSNGSYIPFSFQVITSGIGNVTAATYPTPPDNLPWPTSPVIVTNLVSASGLSPDNRDATVDRFWQVDVTGSGTANLTFNYEGAELPVAPYNNPASMRAQRYETSSNYWQPYFPGQSASPFQVSQPGVSTFGTWTLTNITSPLPITLLSFDAMLKNNQTLLKWTTGTEINNDFFTVEKSMDGVKFISFETINGAGNSTTTLNYSTLDTKPYDGISYYRLKQTDFDGRFTYSPTKAVRTSLDNSHGNIIFPNPATNYFYIHLTGSESNTLLTISDLAGKVIHYSTVPSDFSGGLFLVDITGINSGMYVVTNTNGHASKLIINNH